MTTPETVHISVGSNLGDKLENCRRGVSRLIDVSRARLKARSRIYQTEPVDDTDQDWFVNYVVAIETTRAPLELLADISLVERAAGRVRSGRKFGPRVLDLDILLFGRRVLQLQRLTVPHPRMHKRHFVLRPLCDIDPDIIHPVLNQPLCRLLADLDVTDQQVTVLE
jgi:2-amino-4-hydroxy-6-hydroxymethyldihydropteridine diphosphokinase